MSYKKNSIHLQARMILHMDLHLELLHLPRRYGWQKRTSWSCYKLQFSLSLSHTHTAPQLQSLRKRHLICGDKNYYEKGKGMHQSLLKLQKTCWSWNTCTL